TVEDGDRALEDDGGLGDARRNGSRRAPARRDDRLIVAASQPQIDPRQMSFRGRWQLERVLARDVLELKIVRPGERLGGADSAARRRAARAVAARTELTSGIVGAEIDVLAAARRDERQGHGYD